MAFEVAWKNPGTPLPSDGRNCVTCEICGKTGLPFGDWFFYELPIPYPKLYEYEYWLCSDQCDAKATEEVKKKKIKQLS